MKNLVIAAVLGLSALTALPAAAQVDAHRENQQDRIQQGVRSGELTRGETRRLENQQRSIARQEHRMRSRNGGYLTPRQRARLEERQARASRHIYAAKHNARAY